MAVEAVWSEIITFGVRRNDQVSPPPGRDMAGKQDAPERHQLFLCLENRPGQDVIFKSDRDVIAMQNAEQGGFRHVSPHSAPEPGGPLNGGSALLPAGLADLLPPEADKETALVNIVTSHFAARGYQRVKPPLVEFERNLLRDHGGQAASHTFRLMDPVSHDMLGVRVDITPQIGRIASSRLARMPRPLRLCYAGQVLRVHGNQLRPERQFTQAGVELIGSDSIDADAEVVLLATEALTALEIPGLSVDLTLPALVPGLARWLEIPEARARALREALDHKDAARVGELAENHAPLFLALLQAAGPADKALAALKSLSDSSLPPEAAADCARLADLVARLRAALPDLTITIDPVEHRGFAYEAGLSFAFFAREVRGELGRGGRYLTGPAGQEEPATGFTLYIDSVLRATPSVAMPQRIYLPFGTGLEEARALRAQGLATVSGLEPEPGNDIQAEARRLNCDLVWAKGAISEIPAG